MIFLGTIANAGSDVKNNTNTAVPFVIPLGVTRIVLQPSAATMMASAKATDAAFAPAATDMLQLGAANSIAELPLPYAATASSTGAGPTLAIRKTDAGAGTTKVFGA